MVASLTTFGNTPGGMSACCSVLRSLCMLWQLSELELRDTVLCHVDHVLWFVVREACQSNFTEMCPRYLYK